MSDATTDNDVPDNESNELTSEATPSEKDREKEITFAGYFSIAINIKNSKKSNKTG